MEFFKEEIERRKTVQKKISFAFLSLSMDKIGDDYCVQIRGGDKPHIGCAVLSVPRPSLKDGTKQSVTSSVLNRIGHKDEYICRYVAEKIAREKGKATLCTGGFHVDDITEEQIEEVSEAVKELTEKLLSLKV